MANRRPTRRSGGWDAEAAMLRCRTYGHAWDEFYPDDLGPPAFGWRLSLRCIRCQTQRHDLIDLNGGVGQRRYIYPDGYTLGRDETPTKEQFRNQLFASVREQLNEARAINELIRIGQAS